MASLKLQTNVPETIALAFAEGLPVSSAFGGDQLMMTLVDGRKFYCSPFVAQKIAAAGIGANQPFTICKREVANGNRRTVEYQIEAAAFSENATAVGSTSSSNLTSQSYNGNAARSLHVMSAPPATPPPPPPAAAPAPAPDMSGCYREAIEVTLGAISYAKEHGLLLTPTFEDIRCMAATLLIDSRKGGRA
jgi:hypothetical protein